jgi:hypothetical protein
VNKSPYLNPGGNVFERLYACWHLFWYPQAFVNGVIQAFVANVSAKLTREMAFKAETDSTTVAADLATAAEQAKAEVMNG